MLLSLLSPRLHLKMLPLGLSIFFKYNCGENGKIGVAIGIEAVIITVGISQLPVGIPIGTIIMIKSTIRSTFVK